MLLRMAALALLVASVYAQDAEEAVGEDMIAQPPPGRIARGERDAPAAFVRIREGGVLQVKVGEEWKDASLDDLSKFLKQFAEKQDKELQKSGKSAYETLPGGVRASRLFVSIDAEGTIPWQNLQWLMRIAAEQKYWKLEFSEGTRKMLAFLPTDSGINAVPKEPPMLLLISVHAVARTEKPGVWGGAAVLRPVEVRYKLGNAHEEVSAQADVADYVKKAWAAVKDTPNCTISGEIKAGNKVPFARIFDLMETFEAAKVPAMRFFGGSIPDAAARAAPKLPFPDRNYDRPE